VPEGQHRQYYADNHDSYCTSGSYIFEPRGGGEQYVLAQDPSNGIQLYNDEAGEVTQAVTAEQLEELTSDGEPLTLEEARNMREQKPDNQEFDSTVGGSENEVEDSGSSKSQDGDKSGTGPTIENPVGSELQNGIDQGGDEVDQNRDTGSTDTGPPNDIV